MTNNAVTNWLAELPDKARDESVARLRQLAQDTVNRRVQFLCGAGMSKGSNLPLASDLVVMMAGEMLDGKRPRKPYAAALADLERLYPLEAVAEAYVQTLDPSRMKDMLRELLASSTVTVHAGHDALEYLATQQYIDKVYTTNFDTLLEKGFGARGTTITNENADRVQSERAAGSVPVLHLHGVVDRGTIDSDILITESATYSLNTPLSAMMRADMVVSRFVWIGYSLSDVDLRTIYLSTRDFLKTSGLAKRPFVVHPLNPDDANGLEWRLADRVWSARGATFIPGKAETFLPALQHEVRSSAADEIVRSIVAKKNGDPTDERELQQVWDDAESLAQETGLGDQIEAIYEIAKGHGIALERDYA